AQPCLVRSHQTSIESGLGKGKSMSSHLSRRQFIIALGGAGGAAFISHKELAVHGQPLLYPPVDLSYFDRPLTSAPFEVHFGYAAITWDGNDDQAIKDVSETGFRGIHLRSPILNQYAARPTHLP